MHLKDLSNILPTHNTTHQKKKMWFWILNSLVMLTIGFALGKKESSEENRQSTENEVFEYAPSAPVLEELEEEKLLHTHTLHENIRTLQNCRQSETTSQMFTMMQLEQHQSNL